MISDYRFKLNRLLSQRAHHEQQVQDETSALVKAQARIVAAETAQKVLQHVARSIQESAHAQIAAVVSMCLEAIFDDPYQFEIRFEKKRGKTEAELVFVRNGHPVDPMTAAGGGPKDVASLALRLARIALAQPQRRKVLFLDEPFANLKPPELYGPRVRDLLERLAGEQATQFIMVNNVAEYQTGHIIEL